MSPAAQRSNRAGHYHLGADAAVIPRTPRAQRAFLLTPHELPVTPAAFGVDNSPAFRTDTGDRTDAVSEVAPAPAEAFGEMPPTGS
jgi:hypothetical protein